MWALVTAGCCEWLWEAVCPRCTWVSRFTSRWSVTVEVYKEFREQLTRDPEKGWYETGLPWKGDHPPLPTNKEGSLRRLHAQLSKLRPWESWENTTQSSGISWRKAWLSRLLCRLQERSFTCLTERLSEKLLKLQKCGWSMTVLHGEQRKRLLWITV